MSARDSFVSEALTYAWAPDRVIALEVAFTPPVGRIRWHFLLGLISIASKSSGRVCGHRHRTLWRTTFRSAPPSGFTKDLVARFICWHIQEQAFGGLDSETAKVLDGYAKGNKPVARRLKAGTVLVREYQGERHTVTVVPGGYVWRENTLHQPLHHRPRHHRYGLERAALVWAPHSW
jgi:Protein of unknown function (DUF2924)